jgi:hypothetical protein
MRIEIVGYVPSTSRDVQAYFNILIDSWVRVNGLHLRRDGSIRSGQLTWLRGGRRHFLSAVEIADADLRELVVEEIKSSVAAYAAALPEEARMLPPAPPRPRSAPVNCAQKNPPQEPRVEAAPQPVGPAPAPPKPPVARRAPRPIPAQILPFRSPVRPPVIRAQGS